MSQAPTSQAAIDQAMQLAIRNHQAGKLPEAETVYRQVLVQQPNNVDALHLLGVIAGQTGRFDTAVDLIHRAIAISPSVATLHNNLGNVLADNNRPAEAAIAYREALRLNPNFAQAHNNLGVVLQAEGKWQEAMEAYRAALGLNPANMTSRWNYSKALLILGHWKEGWAEFDSRLKLPRLGLNRNFLQPQWDGSDPAGKTILLHAEGGHGDALNFIRFAPQVAHRGATLILECQPALVPLFEGFPGLHRTLARGEPLPAFDWQIPLQSLPHILGITSQNIPGQVPYLSAPPNRIEFWRQRLIGEKKFRVGLVWAGMKHKGPDPRSRTIDVFAPLAEVAGIKFFSLQAGEDSRQPPPPAMDWADFSADLTDFAEAAALLQNLDLIITVDTSMAHLAGALARPVWVLIPFEPDFRWLLERTDTPWYPTMRLFRQKTRQGWAEVIQGIARALGEFRGEQATLLEQRKISG